MSQKREEDKKKKKKQESLMEKMIYDIMQKSMKTALDKAMDELFKDWK